MPLTQHGQPASLSVAGVSPGCDWAIVPETPELATACVQLLLEDGRHVFLTAPRASAEPSAPVPPVLGLLDLDPLRFGLAQVDVDGGMHKAIILAETWHNPDPGRNLDPGAQPDPATRPEVFDPEATLPALRSGGFSLFADARALQLLHTIGESGAFNAALEANGRQPRPFFAEDLVRGYRLDVWDSLSGEWHSLHFREGRVRDRGPDAAGADRGGLRPARADPAGGGRGARERRPLPARGDRALGRLEPGRGDAGQAPEQARRSRSGAPTGW